MHRRERGRSGNGFSYSDLRTLWGAGDDHAVLSHVNNTVWQYWWRHPSKGWHLQSWHKLLGEAKDEAENPRPMPPEAPSRPPGLYVCAYWNDEGYRGTGPVMVRCSTESTAEQVREAFDNLGCSTELKTLV